MTPTFIDNYESKNILRNLVAGDDDDGDDGDDENRSDYENYGYDNFKRDLIRGPSFISTIDNDSAASEIMKEDNDIGTENEGETKRIVERKTNRENAIDGTNEMGGETGTYKYLVKFFFIVLNIENSSHHICRLIFNSIWKLYELGRKK